VSPAGEGEGDLLDRSLACTRGILLPCLPWAAAVSLPLILGTRALLLGAPPTLLDSPWRTLSAGVAWAAALGLAQLMLTGALAAGVVPAVAGWVAGLELGAGRVLQEGLHNLGRGLLGAGRVAAAWLALVTPAALGVAALSRGAEGAAAQVSVLLAALAAGLWAAAAALLVTARLAPLLTLTVQEDLPLRASWAAARGRGRVGLGVAALTLGVWLAAVAVFGLVAPSPDVVDLGTAGLYAAWPQLLAAQARTQAAGQGLLALLSIPALAALALATRRGQPRL
jgi:hypothetical protein